jgi:hypothetical protein
MALSTPPDVRLKWFRVAFTCAGTPGHRYMYGPSERAVSRVLREHPSMFGLPHETVLVGRVEEVQVVPEGVAFWRRNPRPTLVKIAQVDG